MQFTSLEVSDYDFRKVKALSQYQMRAAKQAHYRRTTCLCNFLPCLRNKENVPSSLHTRVVAVLAADCQVVSSAMSITRTASCSNSTL